MRKMAWDICLKHNTKMVKSDADAAMHEAVPAIASCGVSPLVRIPDMQGWMIKRESQYQIQEAFCT